MPEMGRQAARGREVLAGVQVEAGGPCLQLGQRCRAGEGFLSTLIWQPALAARKLLSPSGRAFAHAHVRTPARGTDAPA